MTVNNTVFVHTNEKQMIGALVSAHSLKRNSKNPEQFDVRIISVEDYPFYKELDGKQYLREKRMDTWDYSDLQSFTTLRFMPPALCNFTGRSIVIDPDVFAVGDINELFERDMQDKAIMARNRSGHKGYANYIATSVMLLDNAKLKHWNTERDFRAMFAGTLDYDPWNRLANEDPNLIGFIEPVWNDFDNLDSNTKLIHNTKRRTQPWKTGLPVDFTNRRGLFGILPSSWTPAGWIKRTKLPGSYWRHPDRRQEEFFFSLLRECLDNGMISKDLLAKHIAMKFVRADALEIAQDVRSVDEVLSSVSAEAA
jgi:hypothetical protein